MVGQSSAQRPSYSQDLRPLLSMKTVNPRGASTEGVGISACTAAQSGSWSLFFACTQKCDRQLCVQTVEADWRGYRVHSVGPNATYSDRYIRVKLIKSNSLSSEFET